MSGLFSDRRLRIQQVLDIGGNDNRLRHTLFAYLILRTDLLTALHIGIANEGWALTLPVAQYIDAGWRASA